MSPRTRKLLLTAHVTASMGWIGALAVFLAHGIASFMTSDEQLVRSVSLLMGVTAWFVIVPFSLASLVTGLLQAVGSAWGLVRHYWVLFKLVITSVATIVLLMKLGPISALADAASQVSFTSTGSAATRTSLTLHAAVGLLMLLAAAILGIYKPAGVTSERTRPRWVKVGGIIGTVLVIAVVVMMVAGGHGPNAHRMH
jgi:hypothetical protein